MQNTERRSIHRHLHISSVFITFPTVNHFCCSFIASSANALCIFFKTDIDAGFANSYYSLTMSQQISLHIWGEKNVSNDLSKTESPFSSKGILRNRWFAIRNSIEQPHCHGQFVRPPVPFAGINPFTLCHFSSYSIQRHVFSCALPVDGGDSNNFSSSGQDEFFGKNCMFHLFSTAECRLMVDFSVSRIPL